MIKCEIPLLPMLMIYFLNGNLKAEPMFIAASPHRTLNKYYVIMKLESERLLDYYMRIVIGSLHLNHGLEKIAWGVHKNQLMTA